MSGRFNRALQGAFVGLVTLMTIGGGMYLRKPVDTGQSMGTAAVAMGLLWMLWVWGLAGIIIAVFCGLPGRYIGAAMGLGLSMALCAWNLATYADYGERIVSPQRQDYLEALAELVLLAVLICVAEPLRRRVPQGFAAAAHLLGRGLIGLWLLTFFGAFVLLALR